MMEEGGNQRLREWFASHGAASLAGAERYKSRAAELYREKLKSDISAQPVPATSPLGVSDPPPQPPKVEQQPPPPPQPQDRTLNSSVSVSTPPTSPPQPQVRIVTDPHITMKMRDSFSPAWRKLVFVSP